MAEKSYNIKARHFADFIGRYGDYEAYAFYVAIRHSFRNSKLFNPTVRNVMRFAGCSYTRAKRLLAKAEEYEIFHFCKRHGDLVALTDKCKEMNFMAKDGAYAMDYIYTLTFDDGVSEKESALNAEKNIKSCKLRDIQKKLKRLYVSHYLSGRTLVHNKARRSQLVHVGGEMDATFEKHVERRIKMTDIACKSGLSRSECSRVLEELNAEGEITKTSRKLVRLEEATENERKFSKIVYDKWNRAWISRTIEYKSSACSNFGGGLSFWSEPKHKPIARKLRHTVKYDTTTSANDYFARLEIDDAVSAKRTCRMVR